MTDPQVQPPEPPRVGSPEQITALTDQCLAGQQAAGKVAQEASELGIDPSSIKLMEVQVRLGILSDALFGDGTPDQLLYEIACHERFITAMQPLMAKVREIREQREREARQAALLQGVQVRATRPGG